MPVRTSHRPSRAPAFLFPPPGSLWDDGPPAAPPWAQGRLQGPSTSRSRESGEKLPGTRGDPCVPGLSSHEPNPSRRPARFRSPRGPSRTHAAAARPFPLPIRSPRARAAFRASVWPFRLPVFSSRAWCGLYRSPSGPHARVRSSSQCSVLGARARSFPPRGLLRSACPARGHLGRGRETPPSCPEGRGLPSAPAQPLPGLPTKDRRAPRFSSSAGGRVGEGPARPLCSCLLGCSCSTVP